MLPDLRLVHVRNHRARGEPCAGQIDVDNLLPFGEAHVGDALGRPRDAGIVHENVDAPECLERFVGHLFAIGFLRHIGLHEDRLGADFFQLGAGLLHRIDGARREHDLRARGAVFERDLLSDSVSATGDDCDFVRKLVHGRFLAARALPQSGARPHTYIFRDSNSIEGLRQTRARSSCLDQRSRLYHRCFPDGCDQTDNRAPREARQAAGSLLSMSSKLRRLVAIVGVCGWLLWAHSEWFRDPQSVKREVVQWGIWGPIIYMVLYAVGPSFLVPGAVMTIAAGLAFGTGWGSVYSLIGADVGAVVAFGAGRWLGKSIRRAHRGRAFSRSAAKNRAQRLPDHFLSADGSGHPVQRAEPARGRIADQVQGLFLGLDDRDGARHDPVRVSWRRTMASDVAEILPRAAADRAQRSMRRDLASMVENRRRRTA